MVYIVHLHAHLCEPHPVRVCKQARPSPVGRLRVGSQDALLLLELVPNLRLCPCEEVAGTSATPQIPMPHFLASGGRWILQHGMHGDVSQVDFCPCFSSILAVVWPFYLAWWEISTFGFHRSIICTSLVYLFRAVPSKWTCKKLLEARPGAWLTGTPIINHKK